MNRQHFMGAWLLALLLATNLAVASPSPETVVRETSDQVLSEVVSRKQELQAQPGKIYQLVEHIVLPRFDFQYMSQLVLGKYWPRAQADEKEAFVHAFRELLVRTYATALLSYSGQDIVYLPTRESSKSDESMINTQVQEPGAPAIPINYRLHQKDGEWLVFDVSIDGVSLVSNYRSSFASQIRRYKLSGLIQKLEQRNAERN